MTIFSTVPGIVILWHCKVVMQLECDSAILIIFFFNNNNNKITKHVSAVSALHINQADQMLW